MKAHGWCIVNCGKSVEIFQCTAKLINSREFPARESRKQVMIPSLALAIIPNFDHLNSDFAI